MSENVRQIVCAGRVVFEEMIQDRELPDGLIERQTLTLEIITPQVKEARDLLSDVYYKNLEGCKNDYSNE